jgi:hypothetical protein
MPNPRSVVIIQTDYAAIRSKRAVKMSTQAYTLKVKGARQDAQPWICWARVSRILCKRGEY